MIQFQQDEKIILTCRRHWLVFLIAIFQVAILMFAVLAIPALLKSFTPEIFSGYDALIYLSAGLILEILWIILFLVIADYYLDIWLITNHRLIFIELKGIFSRTTSSVSLRNIQDVTTEVHGLFETFLKFGNVRVQSAGTEGAFVFRQVPESYQVKDLILRVKEEFIKSPEGGQS